MPFFAVLKVPVCIVCASYRPRPYNKVLKSLLEWVGTAVKVYCVKCIRAMVDPADLQSRIISKISLKPTGQLKRKSLISVFEFWPLLFVEQNTFLEGWF